MILFIQVFALKKYAFYLLAYYILNIKSVREIIKIFIFSVIFRLSQLWPAAKRYVELKIYKHRDSPRISDLIKLCKLVNTDFITTSATKNAYAKEMDAQGKTYIYVCINYVIVYVAFTL